MMNNLIRVYKVGTEHPLLVFPEDTMVYTNLIDSIAEIYSLYILTKWSWHSNGEQFRFEEILILLRDLETFVEKVKNRPPNNLSSP